jgi:hypothetical protein
LGQLVGTSTDGTSVGVIGAAVGIVTDGTVTGGAVCDANDEDELAGVLWEVGGTEPPEALEPTVYREPPTREQYKV